MDADETQRCHLPVTSVALLALAGFAHFVTWYPLTLRVWDAGPICYGFAKMLAVVVCLNGAAYAAARRARWLLGVYLAAGLFLLALWAELSGFASSSNIPPGPNVARPWAVIALFVLLVVIRARRDLAAARSPAPPARESG